MKNYLFAFFRGVILTNMVTVEILLTVEISAKNFGKMILLIFTEKSCLSAPPPRATKEKKKKDRARARNMERVDMLARPTARRLQSLWDEKGALLPRDRRDKIKSALEEDYFLSPE